MFLYYLPRITYADVNASTIAAAGLAAVFRDLLVTPRVTQDRISRRQVHTGGPDGGSGAIFAATPRPGEPETIIGYFRDRQTWLNCGPFWLGYETGTLPAPEVLRRDRPLEGYLHTLGDARDWEVPIVRKAGRISRLPRSMGIDSEGRFTLSPLPEFDAAWDAAGKMFDHIFSPDPFPFSEAFALCVEVLALNYRIGPREAAALKLFTTENFERVFEAAVDMPLVVEMLGPQSSAIGADGEPVVQKKTPEDSSTLHGQPGSSPNIDRPAGISSSLPVESGSRNPSRSLACQSGDEPVDVGG